MAKELDTSWFDLKNYEPLKSMSIVGWASVLDTRTYIAAAYDNFKPGDEDSKYNLECLLSDIKLKPMGYDDIATATDEAINDAYDDEISRLNSFDTSSVSSLQNHQAWEMVKSGTEGTGQEFTDFQKMQDEWLRPWDYDDEDKQGYYSLIRKAAFSSYDFRFTQYCNRDYISSLAHVTIDLNATDEQIENDFSHWLKHYRKASGYRVPKKKVHEKLFTQKTFDKWIEYGLIPYLDLVIAAKIEGKTISQEKLGEVIFPDEPEPERNLDYRIRTITKPEAERLIKHKVHWSLIRQAANEKAVKTKK